MDNTIYIGLSHQAALRRQMDIVAHNVANMVTSGFKSEAPLFTEFLHEVAGQEPLSYVQDFGIVRDNSEGSFTQTGNPLDIAIHGDGYFAIDTERGIRYTRNGNFQLNADGKLVNSAGDNVLDARDRPIKIDAGETEITIAADGTITGRSGAIGRLQVAAFADPQLLRREANSLFRTDQRPEPVREVSVVQGAIEASNVKPIVEVTKMIEILRTYQSASDLIEREEELQRQTIETVMST